MQKELQNHMSASQGEGAEHIQEKNTPNGRKTWRQVTRQI
jgi:hypothetical protein